MNFGPITTEILRCICKVLTARRPIYELCWLKVIRKVAVA